MLQKQLEKQLNNYLKKKRALAHIFIFYNSMSKNELEIICWQAFLKVLEDLKDLQIPLMFEFSSFEQELFQIDYWDTKFFYIRNKKQQEEIEKMIQEDAATLFFNQMTGKEEMLQSPIKIIPEIIKRKEATFYLEELMSSTIPLRKRVKLFELLLQESIDINLLNLSEEFIEEYQKTRKSSQILSIQKRNRI